MCWDGFSSWDKVSDETWKFAVQVMRGTDVVANSFSDIQVVGIGVNGPSLSGDVEHLTNSVDGVSLASWGGWLGLPDGLLGSIVMVVPAVTHDVELSSVGFNVPVKPCKI